MHYTRRVGEAGQWHTSEVPEPLLVIACGALAREITELKNSQGWDHMHLACIDAWLHNRPEKIPGRLRSKIRKYKEDYAQIFVAYADCGTGGELDKVLAEEGIERLPGAHCYEFFAGAEKFTALAAAEPGTYYLTDFLAEHFERFVIKPLKLDSHPELRDTYFGNYHRLVFLSQTENEALLVAAQQAAARLELEFEHVHCGFGSLGQSLHDFVSEKA